MGRLGRVEVLHGATLRIVDVPSGGLEIGRVESAGLFLDAPSVSKRHARLAWDGDTLCVEDLGSTNKVVRDGQVLSDRTVVEDGDELVLGEVVLRVTVGGSESLIKVNTLPETSNVLVPKARETAPPTEVERRAAELLPVVEQFFHARDARDLAKRIVATVGKHLNASRVALLELEDGDRLRVLALQGAKDVSFVSRTVVSEASRRGLAVHQLGAVGRPVAGSLLEANSASAIASLMRGGGDRMRVLYVDVLVSDLGEGKALHSWRHAFELQLFASSAASAFDALRAVQQQSKERLRFEHLRRHFSGPVVEQLSLLTRPETEAIAPQVMPATVVFADLSGLSRLTERWRSRPQALVGLLDLWFEFASRAVFAQSGTLDKFIGDAVMAVFGAPFALDGAPSRALRAVREMHETVARLARDTGEHLQLTAALASGPVFSCMAGSKRRHEYTVLGETVARAAKLRERGGPGEILCDETAAAELGTLWKFEPLPVVQGEAPAWRLLGLKNP